MTRGAATFLGPAAVLAALLMLNLGVSACGNPGASPTSATSGGATTQPATQTAAYSASGNVLTLADRAIKVVEDGRVGVMAADKAQIALSGITLVTMGADSPGLATTRGGSISATDCNVVTSGHGSPCLLARDVISVTGGAYEAIRSEAAVVQPGGSATVTNAGLSSKHKQCGIQLAPALVGDQATGTSQGTSSTAAPSQGTDSTAASTQGAGSPVGGTASFTMSGGSIVYADKGPVFYVEGCTGVIKLSGVKITALSDLIVKASAPPAGPKTKGAAQTTSTVPAGAHAVLTADGQRLVGDISADAWSVVELTMSDASSLVGSIDTKNKAREIDLTLDAGSTWKVTADSYVSGLSLAAGVSGSTIISIIGNHHTVYYDPSSASSSALAGKTYNLQGGGYLKPAA